MARTHWPGESPIGRRIKLTNYDREGPWFTIAAVVRDTRHAALDSALRPQVYVHYRRDPWPDLMWVVVRTAGDPSAMAAAARAAVLEIDANQPVSRVLTMPDVVAASVSDRRFSMTLVGIFAVLALTLSVVGLYAVVSYSVAERIHEMGVRLALGAQPSNLLSMVLGEGLRLVIAGLALGVVCVARGHPLPRHAALRRQRARRLRPSRASFSCWRPRRCSDAWCRRSARCA